MLNFEKLELILKKLEEKNLLKIFIISVFEIKKEDIDSYIINYQYNKDFIIDMFTIKEKNTFIRYCFTKDDNNIKYTNNNSNISCYVININKKYNNKKISLFNSLLYTNNYNEVLKILSQLFNKEIVDLITKYIER